MREIISSIQFDIDEIARIAQRTMNLLTCSDRSTGPIRYRLVLEDGMRLRVLWASHADLSQKVYAFIAKRDPRFIVLLERATAEHERLADELKQLTPKTWPRSTELGLNSLRIRAFHTLPTVLRELEDEQATILPLLRRWVYGGVAESSVVEWKSGFLIGRQASA